MATKFKKGDVVKAVAVVPEGPVEALRMDENGNFYYQISWADVNGEAQQRWFAEEDLTAE
jgi:hypothetical protein